MQVDPTVTAIAEVIRLAVAPVFLLTGVGAMLGVLTNRLNRIIDRARLLESRLLTMNEDEHSAIHENLALLSHRANLVQWAISLSTTCALLICTVIVVLFLEAFLSLDLPGVVALLFIAAMLVFIAALFSFLREIHLALASLRIGPPARKDGG